MSTFKIILMIVCALILSLVLKTVKSDFSRIIVLIAGVISLIFACTQLEAVTELVNKLSDIAGLSQNYMDIILKSIVICLLGELAAQMCKDCGEGALAQNTEFVCRCSILALSIPLYTDVFNMILKLWEDI